MRGPPAGKPAVGVPLFSHLVLGCPLEANIATQSVGALRHQSFELTVVSRAEVGRLDAVFVWEKRRPGCLFILVAILDALSVALLVGDEGHAVTQNRLDLLSLLCIVSGHMQDGQ